ncbi:Sodium Bile acid symporter family protein [Posidoniimonas polymericola]|uniref:Sodium Bile acid symporter family protein n=1 Tax=Posidoniimonas polymericola TaxID=2528002 RepID=A0A5C5YCR1_9BACT|nr:bile acid:sodium symporter [Posidoniimonas polymericola]TWT72728.1 Sodium Bile acid symporter family protein [Posidoniimonas polymericola]
MRRFFAQRWFLFVLMTLLLGGLALCGPLAFLPRLTPKLVVIGVVMLATSLATNFGLVLRARDSWLAVGLALLVNAGVAPPLGWLIGRPLPPPLAEGLVVAMTVPCTIAAAIVWTRRGGGNDAAAALTSMISNFSCFLVLPFWTGLLMGATVDIKPRELMIKLLLGIAAPMVAGQLIRAPRRVGAWADRQKRLLSLIAQWGVLFMALLGAIEAGNAMRGSEFRPTSGHWLLLVGMIIVLHMVLLAVAAAAGWAARLGPADALAVTIAGSQKSMAVGVGVALQFGPMTIFPLITYHFAQLLIDTVVVDRHRRKTGPEQPPA